MIRKEIWAGIFNSIKLSKVYMSHCQKQNNAQILTNPWKQGFEFKLGRSCSASYIITLGPQ